MISDHVMAGAPVREGPAETGTSRSSIRLVRTRRRYGKILNTAAMAVVAFAFSMPFIWMLISSVKPAPDIFRSNLHGSEFRWENFRDAFRLVPFGRFILNGVFVSAVGTLLVLAVSTCGAYAFARLRFRGRDKLFLLYLVTLMLPQEILVVPMYLLMKQLHLIDSYAALILPWAFGAFGTFLLRQFLATLPVELEEAARIDGASRLRTLVSIHVPLIRPALAVLGVFTFIGYWNNFLWPLIITNSESRSTVPLGLNYFTSQAGTQWGPLMAGSAIALVPCVVLVLILQRHLVAGLALGGFGGR
jgi:multiple sugar transport system permease protein